MLANLYSMADYSATVRPIPIWSFGRVLGSTSATRWYKVRRYAVNTHGATGLAISNTRWQIPPQPLEVFQLGLREVVRLDASYTPV